MSDIDEFTSKLDETLLNVMMMSRDHDIPADRQLDGNVALIVSQTEALNRGTVIFAVGSFSSGLDHVSLSLHGFVDGERVELTPMVLNGEVLVSLQCD